MNLAEDTSISLHKCLEKRAKAVGILYRGEKPRTSVLHDKYYLNIAFNGFIQLKGLMWVSILYCYLPNGAIC